MVRPQSEPQSAFRIGVLAALFLAACSATQPLLNSERIEQKYGSYGVEIIRQDDTRRESSLYSGFGDNRVTRTYAVTEFTDPEQAAYRDEHAAIIAGASIGKTFREAGWDIRKETVVIHQVTIPADNLALGRLMQIGLPAELAVWEYRFVVSKAGRSFTYARITEYYHPDYLTLKDLQ